MGSGHALEQDNKLMKVTGGIVGLTQNPSALNRFFLIAPVLNSISTKFQSIYGCDASTQRTQHYQLLGDHLHRQVRNTKKLIDVMDTFELTFTENDAAFNVLSKAVIPDFVDKRLHGDVSIWAPFKKRNLKSFKTELNKTLKSTVQGKIVQLKEDKSLISRFLITSRKRPEIDLEFCLGNFEFSVVPKALFSPDGEPLPSTDKSKILHQIEELAKQYVDTEVPNDAELHQQNRVLILDGMAVVNQLNKNMKVKTCKVSIVKHTKRYKTIIMQRDISISQCYEAVGPRRAKALLGFHAITGCDQTGRFNGKTKGGGSIS